MGLTIEDITTDYIIHAHPATLYRDLDKLMGSDSDSDSEETPWLEWDAQAFDSVFPGVSLEEHEEAEIALDKLLAVKAAAYNLQGVCTQAAVFENVVLSFCNQNVLPTITQEAEIPEINYAVTQLKEIMHDVHGPEATLPLGGEVPSYIAAAAKVEGMPVLPLNLAAADAALDYLYGRNLKRLELIQELIPLRKQLAEEGTLRTCFNILDQKKSTDAWDVRYATLMLIACIVYDPTQGSVL